MQKVEKQLNVSFATIIMPTALALLVVGFFVFSLQRVSASESGDGKYQRAATDAQPTASASPSASASPTSSVSPSPSPSSQLRGDLLLSNITYVYNPDPQILSSGSLDTNRVILIVKNNSTLNFSGTIEYQVRDEISGQSTFVNSLVIPESLALKPGEETTLYSVYFSYFSMTGRYRLVGTIDPANKISETNETNNTLTHEINITLPTPTASPSPVSSPAPTLSPSPSASASPTPTPVSSPTASPSLRPTATATPTPTPTPSPSSPTVSSNLPDFTVSGITYRTQTFNQAVPLQNQVVLLLRNNTSRNYIGRIEYQITDEISGRISPLAYVTFTETYPFIPGTDYWMDDQDFWFFSDTGQYRFQGKIDPLNTIQESNENNNEMVQEITLPGATFLRGDANQDNRVDISDSIAITNFLNLGGTLACLDAADADDDGIVTSRDAAYLRRWLFEGTEQAPSAPGTLIAGTDPTDDSIGCLIIEGNHISISGAQFLRGDANSDGKVDITDSIVISNIIEGNYRSQCLDSADVNDDGRVNNRDYAYILDFLFRGGPEIPKPYGYLSDGRPNVSGDSTFDSMRCLRYSAGGVSPQTPTVTPSPRPLPSVSPTPAPQVRPTPVLSTIRIGDLIKERGKPAVYVLVDLGIIRAFVNEPAFYANYQSFAGIKEVTTLSGYAQGEIISGRVDSLPPRSTPEENIDTPAPTVPTPATPTLVQPAPQPAPSPSPASSPRSSPSPTVTSTPVPATTPVPVTAGNRAFLRGDANADGVVDQSDSVAITDFINAARPLICKDSADVNDDGSVNIFDAAYLQRWLFLGGPEPKSPYPQRGSDLTQDRIDCAQYPR